MQRARVELPAGRRSRHGTSRGIVVRSLLVFLVLAAIVLSVVGYIFGDVVRPGEMGVRQITMGPYQGFSETALQPGYHWNIPIYSRIHHLPSTLQFLHLSRELPPTKEGENSDVHRAASTLPGRGALEIQTLDGSSVELDTSILFRFYDGTEEGHGGPAELMTKVGGPQDALLRIETAAVNELKKSLGKLSTSEFYNPDKREAEISAAEKGMSARLKDYGVKIEAVLLKRYTYTEERIDSAIFQKNLQDQEERLNTAQGKLSGASAELEKVRVELDAQIKALRAQANKQETVVRSEADLYETTKRAEGDLLVAQARADVDKLRAGALAKSAGASIYLGRELAPLLASLRGGVVSEINPYDLKAWMTRLGVSASAAEPVSKSN